MRHQSALEKIRSGYSGMLGDQDFASQVRGLARGWAPAFTPDAIMGVREFLAMLGLPPRGPVENRALAMKVLDLLSASQPDHHLTLDELFRLESSPFYYPPLLDDAAGSEANARRIHERWLDHRRARGSEGDAAAVDAFWRPISDEHMHQLPEDRRYVVLHDQEVQTLASLNEELWALGFMFSRSEMIKNTQPSVAGPVNVSAQTILYLRPRGRRSEAVNVCIPGESALVPSVLILSEQPEELRVALCNPRHARSVDELVEVCAAWASGASPRIAKPFSRLGFAAHRIADDRVIAGFEAGLRSERSEMFEDACLGAQFLGSRRLVAALEAQRQDPSRRELVEVALGSIAQRGD